MTSQFIQEAGATVPHVEFGGSKLCDEHIELISSPLIIFRGWQGNRIQHHKQGDGDPAAGCDKQTSARMADWTFLQSAIRRHSQWCCESLVCFPPGTEGD